MEEVTKAMKAMKATKVLKAASPMVAHAKVEITNASDTVVTKKLAMKAMAKIEAAKGTAVVRRMLADGLPLPPTFEEEHTTFDILKVKI